MKSVFMRWVALLSGLLVLLSFGLVQAAKVSDVRGTKHNLSAPNVANTYVRDGVTLTNPARTIMATSETQVCVFCHTPHAAENIPKAGSTPGAPLWNRKLSGATYTPYTSTSIEANATELSEAPGGSSKLCLSCHDGTMAIDKVNVLNGVSSPTIAMNVPTEVKMPSGSGVTTGFTRNLGANLTNDHPISFAYNAALATADGELRAPAAENTSGGVVMNRAVGKAKPVLPLENNQVQCATCHDPHLRETDPLLGNAKFLRLNRLQASQPGNTFDPAKDTICLACHEKGGLDNGSGFAWANSAHANSAVATQVYKNDAADLREFPRGTKVWQAGCLNCHDTHTVQGARRLLREGVDSASSLLAAPKAGGKPALEETCYQCHTVAGNATTGSAVTYTANTSNAIPDIKTDFELARRMPIKTTDQASGANTEEVHQIGGVFDDTAIGGFNCANTPIPTGNCGKDLLESRAKLGFNNLNNRHVECTDCHNPHRVVKFRDFRGNPLGATTGPGDPAGTHPHTDTAMNHTNIASGVLRGSWGVEPSYGLASFQALPTGYAVKKGDPGASVSNLVTATFVTREYQICLKCHSGYAYNDTTRPTLGSFTGGTPSGTNGLTIYTNQAKEFQAPNAHQGEGVDRGNDAGSADSTSASGRFNVNNHRSWHPVMKETNRTAAARGMSSSDGWLAPWNNQLGSNTMYCSDCHGSSTADTTAIPTGGDNGNPWGPHGSNNNFLLKGVWGASMGATGRDSGVTSNLLCFKCHAQATYSTRSNSSGRSAFSGGGKGNLHNYHVDKMDRLYCTNCHVAVPHGWKNRSLLVNLNDVGEEAGLGVGSSKEVAIDGNSGVYSQQPYYLNAKLKIRSFASPGSWSDSNCGSVGKSGTGLTTGIINGSGGSGNNTGGGKNWMTSTCSSPP